MSTETEELRNVIFNMLNFTNMYCLVLDRQMTVQFVNMSLAMDLGYKSYDEILHSCWKDFIPESERVMMEVIHNSVSLNTNNWEEKYREVHSSMLTKEKKELSVYWFNSHIGSDLNWTFSFGIKKTESNEENIRDFYYDMIKKDRVIINSMRDAMGLRDKIVDTCKTTFMNNHNNSMSYN